MNVSVKNTFLAFEDESDSDAPKRNSRRSQTLPREWKQSMFENSDACSDASTTYSPGNSNRPSLEEDVSAVAAALSGFVESSPIRHVDVKADVVTSAIHAFLTRCLPVDCVRVDWSMVEDSRKVFIHVEPQDNMLSIPRCYELMQGVKQHLGASASLDDGLSLLSARAQKEDYGYSLRSSVVCIPEGKEDQMCWDFLRKGSCQRRKCCRWYHPQSCDVLKLKVFIRCRKAVPLGAA